MNILVISSSVGLFEPKSGGQNRFYNLVTELAKGDNHITVLSPAQYKTKKTQVPLKEYYFKQYSIKNKNLTLLTDFNLDFVLKLLKILRTEKIDIIQVYSFRGILLSKILTKIRSKNCFIVYDAHNVYADSEKYASNNPEISRLERFFVITLTTILEKIAVKIADYIIPVSHEDKNRFCEKYRVTAKKMTVIPSGVNVSGLTILKDKNKIKKEFNIDLNKIIIIFHGAYFYFPNKEAIDLIIYHIASKIRKNNPNVVFVIAGLDVPLFEKDNIESIGFVEDIYSLLHTADIAIVPILGGGGTRLKILDYLGVGLPIITTKKGIEGINAKNGKHAIIVDDVNEEFINAIKYLIDNEQERRRIGANARRLADEEYDWNKIGEKLDKLYREILEERKHANK